MALLKGDPRRKMPHQKAEDIDYKDLAYKFYMLHEECVEKIEFYRNGVSFLGLDEGELTAVELYKEIMEEARRAFSSGDEAPTEDGENN